MGAIANNASTFHLYVARRFLYLPNRPHLHTAVAHRRKSRRHLNRFVQVSCLNEKEPAELLLGFRKRSIRDRSTAVQDAYGHRRLDRLKRFSDDEMSALVQG